MPMWGNFNSTETGEEEREDGEEKRAPVVSLLQLWCPVGCHCPLSLSGNFTLMCSLWEQQQNTHNEIQVGNKKIKPACECVCACVCACVYACVYV